MTQQVGWSMDILSDNHILCQYVRESGDLKLNIVEVRVNTETEIKSGRTDERRKG